MFVIIIVTTGREYLKDLVRCASQQSCITVDKRPLRECMSDTAVLFECDKYRNIYLQCKRSQLDMRSRMRGNVTLR